MAKDPDFEKKHPRDPDDGRFTETWAQGISDEIGRRFTPEEAAPIHDALGRLRQSMGRMDETLRQTGQHIRRTVREEAAAQSDPLFHQEMSDMVEQDAAERARQALRERALFAFDKPGNLRRQISAIYDEFGIEERESIDGYISVLRMEDIHEPLDQAGLDYALSNHTAYIFDFGLGDAKGLLAKLRRDERRTGRGWPETISQLEDIIGIIEGD